MKVWFKRILIGLLLVLLAALLAVTVFVLTFNPNEYKYKLEEFVFERYQRSLAINGDIELSVFPRIGLAVSDVELSDRDSESLFASVDNARFAVAIWPLLFNQLLVDHVAIDGLKAWVQRDADGLFNFDDLVRAGTPEAVPMVLDPAAQLLNPAQAQEPLHPLADDVLPAVPQAETTFKIDIAGIELKDSEVHYSDAASGHRLRLVDLQLNTGRLTFDQAFDVALKGRLLGDKPQASLDIDGQAQAKIDPLIKQYSVQKLSVRVNGDAEALAIKGAQLKGNLAYSGYDGLFKAGAIEASLKGAMAGKQPIDNLDLSLGLSSFKMDRRGAELQLDKLVLRGSGDVPQGAAELALNAPRLAVSPVAAAGEPVSATFKVTGDDVLGLAVQASGFSGYSQKLSLKAVKLEARYKSAAQLIQADVSTPAEYDASSKTFALTALKGDVAFENPEVSGQAFSFPLLGTAQADWQNHRSAADLNAILSGSPLNLRIRSEGVWPGKIRFEMRSDGLDLDRIMSSVAADSSSSKPSNDGHAAKADAPQAEAPAPVPEAPADTSGQSVLDALSQLDGLDIAGDIQIGFVSRKNLRVDKLKTALRVQDGTLALEKLTADVYEGRLLADWSVNSKGQTALKASLAGVAVGPLLQAATGKQRLSGRGTASVDLRSQGTGQPDLLRHLQGGVKLRVTDGELHGIDLEQTIGRLGGVLGAIMGGETPVLKQAPNLDEHTHFSLFDARAQFNAGVGDISSLTLDSPLFQVRSDKPATLNLAENSIKLLTRVKVVGGSQSKHPEVFAALKNLSIPLLIEGDLQAPEFTLQWQDVKSRIVQSAIRTGLSRQLEKLGLPMRPDEPDSAAQQPAPGASGKNRAAEAQETIKDLGKSLKGLLKK